MSLAYAGVIAWMDVEGAEVVGGTVCRSKGYWMYETTLESRTT